jgi:hypothetical protein
MSLEELCYGDINWPIRVTVYDYNASGRHREIGMFETSIHEMSHQRVAVRGNADREAAFEISKEDRGTTRGLIVVLKAEIQLEESSIQNIAKLSDPTPNVITPNPNWEPSQPSLPVLQEF